MWRLYIKLKGQKRFKPYGGNDALQVTNLIHSPLFTDEQKEHLVAHRILEEFKTEPLVKDIEFRKVPWSTT